MRGGTSKGLFFRDADLPEDPELRDAILLRAMGSPDPRQVDGLGSGFSSASKAAIIAPPEGPGEPVRYLFGQVSVTSPLVDYQGNCGNLSAAVGPFAIDEKMIEAVEPVTAVNILNLNTGKMIVAEVPVQDGNAMVEGDCEIAGVRGSGAPIYVCFDEPGGSVTKALLPTGNRLDGVTLDGGRHVEVSLVDAGNPTVFVRGEDVGLTGDESPAEVDADADVLTRLEAIRGWAAQACGLVTEAAEAASSSPAIPKVAMVSPLEINEDIHFKATILSMGKTHKAYALTGAIATAAAAKIEGTVVHSAARESSDPDVTFQHPSGQMTLQVEVEEEGGARPKISWVKTVRTARRLMEGFVLVPAKLLSGEFRNCGR